LLGGTRRVEVVEILVGSDPGAHRADIKAEQGSADGAEGGEDCLYPSVFHIFWLPPEVLYSPYRKYSRYDTSWQFSPQQEWEL